MGVGLVWLWFLRKIRPTQLWVELSWLVAKNQTLVDLGGGVKESDCLLCVPRDVNWKLLSVIKWMCNTYIYTVGGHVWNGIEIQFSRISSFTNKIFV